MKPRVVGCHAASVCLTVVVLCISLLSLRDAVNRTLSGQGMPYARWGSFSQINDRYSTVGGLRQMKVYTAACTG